MTHNNQVAGKIIFYNGKFLSAGIPFTFHSDRAFRYGDGLFESIRLSGGTVRFFPFHYARLAKGMRILQMKKPAYLNEIYLHNIILELALKNNLRDARVRLQLSRSGHGFYTPRTEGVSVFIDMHSLPAHSYTLDKAGVSIDIYRDIPKPLNILSPLKTCNALPFVMAGIFKKKHRLGNVILLDEKGFLSEASDSNIFLVEKGICFTPSLQNACVDGVMRRVVLGMLKKNKRAAREENIEPGRLLAADEVFLVNAVSGVSWVKIFRKKIYTNETSRMLAESLVRLR